MREIKIGEQTVRVRATPLALLFYKQEFGSDIMGDLTKLAGVEKDHSKFDSVAALQLVWAMAKADSFGRGSFPSFMEWLNSLEGLDLSDQNLFAAAYEEAANGFFRNAVKPAAK